MDQISRNISRKKVRFGWKRFPEKWVETTRNPWVGQLVGGASGHEPGPRQCIAVGNTGAAKWVLGVGWGGGDEGPFLLSLVSFSINRISAY